MICENCKKEHEGRYGSGRFCGKKCARSFSTKNSDNMTLSKQGTCPKCGKVHKVKLRASATKTLCNKCKRSITKRPTRERNRTCLCCGAPLKNFLFRFCGPACQHEYAYLIYINKWKLGLVDGVRGKSSLSNHIKKYFMIKHNSTCPQCGWSQINQHTNKVPLELHHIDGDCTNNKEDNLDLLCPNCHILTSNYRSANKNSTRVRTKK